MMEILVGPIASGKSTYARKRAAEGALIINDDALVAMLHAGDDTRYNTHNKNTYNAIETAAIVPSLPPVSMSSSTGPTTRGPPGSATLAWPNRSTKR
jgi:hypothetical protein